MANDFKLKMEPEKVVKAVEKGSITSLSRASYETMQEAKKSIRPQRRKRKRKKGKKRRKRKQKKTGEGQPPRTKKGQLRKAILYKVDNIKFSSVIGPTKSKMGTSASAHEFGGEYRGAIYPERPFMGPALQRVLPKLPDFWEKSIKR